MDESKAAPPADAAADGWFEGSGQVGGGGTDAAITNAAAGILGSAAMQRAPWLGAALTKLSGALSLSKHMGTLQYGPWGDLMMPTTGYGRPSALELKSRVVTNVGAFGGNYVTVGSGLTVLSILFHPLLLFLGAGLFYGFRRAQTDEAVVIAGRTLSTREKSAGMMALSAVVILLTGALQTVLWIMCFVLAVITVHASLRVPPTVSAQAAVENIV
jgi:hypothetical protein